MLLWGVSVGDFGGCAFSEDAGRLLGGVCVLWLVRIGEVWVVHVTDGFAMWKDGNRGEGRSGGGTLGGGGGL